MTKTNLEVIRRTSARIWEVDEREKCGESRIPEEIIPGSERGHLRWGNLVMQRERQFLSV